MDEALRSALIGCNQFLEFPDSPAVLSCESLGGCLIREGVDARRATVEGHLGRLLVPVCDGPMLKAEVKCAALDDVSVVGRQRRVGIEVGQLDNLHFSASLLVSRESASGAAKDFFLVSPDQADRSAMPMDRAIADLTDLAACRREHPPSRIAQATGDGNQDYQPDLCCPCFHSPTPLALIMTR